MSKDPVNILLVDDQPAKLLSYEVILSELGENLIKASSGNEALNHLLRTEVAVVLVDVCMPGLDGFELAKMISEHPRLQNTAIILISAVFMSDLDRLKGYHSGAVDYVPVPIIPEVLRAKVRVFAELYRVTKQLRELNAELERRVEQRTAALEASTAELRRSEELFRLVTETIPSMVWIATPEGHISYANRRWHEYSGLPATGDGLRWPDEHVHPDDQARWRSLWTTTEPEQRSVEIEVRKRRHDGVYRWFLVRAVPRRAADGRVVAWFGVSTDIQEKKAMEERLRDADRRKDEFLAVLAHELRNPLSPILNAITILQRESFEHPQHAWCRDVIGRQAAHLSRLVDDLLDVSRITSGKVKLQSAPVDLATVVARAVEANRPLIDHRRHRLQVAVPDVPLIVEGDLLRLAQVVGNLLNNAAKYTPDEGQIAIDVAREDGGEGPRAVIRVRDSGVGIPAAMLTRVFDLFVQGEANTEQAQGGLGIGLALVQSLVRLHGGSVVANSQGSGCGSEFVVTLPLAAPDVQGRAPAPARKEARRNGPHVVLVADDNTDSAESLAILLRASGHRVYTVADGVEAVAAAEKIRPTVVLLDVGMPRMNGYDAARHIRAHPWGQRMLLIAQTGWGQEQDRRRSASAGFDAHLTKPLDLEALLRLLNERAAVGRS